MKYLSVCSDGTLLILSLVIITRHARFLEITDAGICVCTVYTPKTTNMK